MFERFGWFGELIGLLVRCLVGLMIGWFYGLLDDWNYDRFDLSLVQTLIFFHSCLYGLSVDILDGLLNCLMVGWMDGWMNGWIEGWMADGWLVG